MIGDQEIKDGIERIAKSADGKLLYLFLQRSLMGVLATADDCALRANAGERLFAAKLIGMMAKGIEDSGGSSDSIYTFAVAGPRAVSQRHGAGRRITDDTIIPGYTDPDTSA